MKDGAEEPCLVDSAATNSILRDTKYFQTLQKRTENILTIAGSNGCIISSGRLVEPPLYSLTILESLLMKLSYIQELNVTFLPLKTSVVVVIISLLQLVVVQNTSILRSQKEIKCVW